MLLVLLDRFVINQKNELTDAHGFFCLLLLFLSIATVPQQQQQHTLGRQVGRPRTSLFGIVSRSVFGNAGDGPVGAGKASKRHVNK
jgi:hypothetical protein